MRVLYVSKASCVAAHRDKLAELGKRVELTLLAPTRWGSTPYQQSTAAERWFETDLLAAHFHGHNHFHIYRGLGRVLQRGAFDLIHVDEEPYSLVTLQVVTRARRLGTPSLFFAWQNLDKRLPPPFGALRTQVFRLAAGGIAGNQEAADVVRRRGFDGPLAVIPQMGVDPARFRADPTARASIRSRLRVADEEFLIGYVGRLVREKGVDLLLRALPAVPRGRLVLLGDGPERRVLEQQCRTLGLAGRVEFVGEIPSLEVVSWLPALDCLALPSRSTPRWKEQFGRVLIEAMACQVPVVGSGSGEIPRVIGDGGRVFPEGDVSELTRELSALAESPELRRRLGCAGRTRVVNLFSQDHVVDATVDFYRSLAPRIQRSPGAALERA